MKKIQINDIKSLAHTTWNCKYHIVFAPKYRINFHQLCWWKSRLRGYLKDIENKNKSFSYNKTIKLLDIINYIYIDRIREINYEEISNYKKSKYLYNEIISQSLYIYL